MASAEADDESLRRRAEGLPFDLILETQLEVFALSVCELENPTGYEGGQYSLELGNVRPGIPR